MLSQNCRFLLQGNVGMIDHVDSHPDFESVKNSAKRFAIFDDDDDDAVIASAADLVDSDSPIRNRIVDGSSHLNENDDEKEDDDAIRGTNSFHKRRLLVDDDDETTRGTL